EASLDRARAATLALGDPYERARVEIIAARLCVFAGRREQARALYSQATGILTELGERHERARALAAWAEVAADPESGRRLRVRAAACFEEVGASDELRALEDRLFG